MDLFDTSASSPEAILLGTECECGVYRIVNYVEKHAVVDLSCYKV